MLEPIDKSEIINIQSNEQFQIENLEDYHNILIHLDNLSENVQHELLKLSPLNILYFKNSNQKIKELAIDNCEEVDIKEIHKCLIFDDYLHQVYTERCKELNCEAKDKNISNKEFQNAIYKIIISEVDEESNETLKFPLLIPIEQKIRSINTNPLSLIRILTPTYDLCQLAIDGCRKHSVLNRIIFNINLNDFPDLYMYYLKRHKEI